MRWSVTCWIPRQASWTWGKTLKEWFRLQASQRFPLSMHKRSEEPLHRALRDFSINWIKIFRFYPAQHFKELYLCVFRSWSCWWRATSSARRSRQPPIRPRLAPMLCCRWPSSSKAGAETSCRRSALHASSWSTLPAQNEQHRCVCVCVCTQSEGV